MISVDYVFLLFYGDFMSKHSRKYMNDRNMQYKVELLERCESSREIYDSLDSQVSNWYHECNDDSYAVDDEPYCGPWYIDRHLELLSDLREYTELVKDGEDIPEHLTYITPFWKDVE